MEVIHIGDDTGDDDESILHVCGGDPVGLGDVPAWLRVFSTCVEVILRQLQSNVPTKSILHVCGGDPNPSMQGDWDLKYSPRVWR